MLTQDIKRIKVATAGLGIILVILGHLSGFWPLYTGDTASFALPYLFHMPLFFFLAGIGLRASDPVASTLRFIALEYLAYLMVWALFYLLAGIVMASFGFASMGPTALSWRAVTLDIVRSNMHHIPLFLTGWFLVALASGKAIAFLSLKGLSLAFARKAYFHLLIILMVLLSFWIGIDTVPAAFRQQHLWWLNTLSQTLVALGFILLGHLCEPLLPKLLMRVRLSVLAAFSVGLAILLYALSFRPMSIAWSEFHHPWWVEVPVALCFILFALKVSERLIAARLDRVPVFFGLQSKAIMTHHLFGFALVNVVLCLLPIPAFQRADVKVFSAYSARTYWPIYLISALAISYLFYVAQKRLLGHYSYAGLLNRLSPARAPPH